MKRPSHSPNHLATLKENQEHIVKLLSNQQFTQFVTACNKKYYHWDILKHIRDQSNTRPELTWAVMKLLRTPQYRPLKIGGYDFLFSTPNVMLGKLHQFDTGGAGRILSPIDNINLEGRKEYVISSLMEEAIASSQLEGAATTRRVAKEILRLKKQPQNRSEQMIVNGYLAMQHITRIKDKSLTPELILELQAIITKGTLDNDEHVGAWRDSNDVTVADKLDPALVYHQPPDHMQISLLMSELCAFANRDEEEFIHPLVKGIILHFLLGYIHPFNDGNGRTARAVFYWYALHKGYWLFEFMAVSRIILRSQVNYGLAYLYSETDENDITYFITHNVDAIDEAFKEMQKHIIHKQKEQAEALKLIRGTKGINLRQAQLLKEILRQPAVPLTFNSVAGMYGVVYQTARTDVLQLVKLGYLAQSKVGKKFVFSLKPKAFVK
jgi:Fic family protein